MTDLNTFYLFNKIINESKPNEEKITNIIKHLSPKNKHKAYDAMEKKKIFTEEIRQRIQENVKTSLKKEKESLKKEKEKERLKYRFKICVREGAPGSADDDEYVSTEYNTFEDVYTASFKFNMNTRWPRLRMVQKMDIILNDKIELIVQPTNYGIMIDDFKTLAITEEEFDKIIDKLSS